MSNERYSGKSNYYNQFNAAMSQVGGMGHPLTQTGSGMRSPYDAEIQRHREQIHNVRITANAEKELQEQEKQQEEDEIYYLLS